VIAANVRALQLRAPTSPALARHREVAQILTGAPEAEVADGVAFLRNLVGELGVRGLGEYGLRESDLTTLIAQGQRASSMKGNPITLTDGELRDVLLAAL
jgi:alcohol dehydrogenase class IV